MDRVSGAFCTRGFRQLRLDFGGWLMAREYGGKFSQNQGSAPVAKKASNRPKAGFRARLLFYAPLPLVFSEFGAITTGNVPKIIGVFAAFVLLTFAAWLLREGLKAEAAYIERANAQRPALPRKIIAAGLSGLGVCVAVWVAGNGVLLPVVLAILAFALHLIAFGLDPLKSKGRDGFNNAASRRVARAIDAAQEHIDTMLSAMTGVNDRKLTARLNGFIASVQEMLRLVEDDPSDLKTARKYLSVYLKGASDATVKFVELYKKSADPKVRADYEALLTDLEKNFDAQQKHLLLDDRSDLDVEIEVLRERLRHEGVAAE
jgi:hypothetical protein